MCLLELRPTLFSPPRNFPSLIIIFVNYTEHLITFRSQKGGGEAPKALSGRVIVAAYWLFVVLMLATFTANLAAFLTVERMQSPVQSLDQLSRQSRINYTVVNGSDTHQYFKNMKHAEDKLYELWKGTVLSATSDQTMYR